jgi:UDP-2,3-diacylglucosamine pyrophosphatase LpxH
MNYRSIFISDCHLGFKRNSSGQLEEFLKSVTCDTLYLVGDIIDFWELERKVQLSESDTAVIRQILQMKRNGTKVFYVIGNHDAMLRCHPERFRPEGITFANEVCHVGLDGKRYLVVHGDIFDNAAPIWEIVSRIGGQAYSFSIAVGIWYNKLRAVFGQEPWSLSAYLKANVKSAANYINKFEAHMVEYCKEGNYDGAICGHIHHASIRNMEGLIYMNCGDWVESCTALVETVEGEFKLIP